MTLPTLIVVGPVPGAVTEAIAPAPVVVMAAVGPRPDAIADEDGVAGDGDVSIAGAGDGQVTDTDVLAGTIAVQVAVCQNQTPSWLRFCQNQSSWPNRFRQVQSPLPMKTGLLTMARLPVLLAIGGHEPEAGAAAVTVHEPVAATAALGRRAPDAIIGTDGAVSDGKLAGSGGGGAAKVAAAGVEIEAGAVDGRSPTGRPGLAANAITVGVQSPGVRGEDGEVALVGDRTWRSQRPPRCDARALVGVGRIAPRPVQRDRHARGWWPRPRQPRACPGSAWRRRRPAH